jgi:hypothetical protein
VAGWLTDSQQWGAEQTWNVPNSGGFSLNQIALGCFLVEVFSEIGSTSAPIVHSVVSGPGPLYTVAFGIVDVGDALFSSGLLIDNVDIAAVPEIGAVWLGAMTCAATSLVVGLRRVRIARRR